jgi:predicted GH43/DUF377 family glycosyl hydrolase
VTAAPHATRLDGVGLRPEPGRVVNRLFLPGEEQPAVGRSRTGAVVDRVLALPEDEVERLAAHLVDQFAARHRDYVGVLHEHAERVGSHLSGVQVSASRDLVLGAAVTAEFAVEGAALCNPSAVPHPDQSGLADGELRVAVSLRAIGEGHLSSIAFAEAVVGPGPTWRFSPRELPVTAGTTSAGQWPRNHLAAVLDDRGHADELTLSVLAKLPDRLHAGDLQQALDAEHPDLLLRAGSRTTVDRLRNVVASAYDVGFPDDVALSQRVLLPSAPEEVNGMEDARFVRFVDEDGTASYRATYTAYDGRHIAPRLLLSSDLSTFSAHRLAGPAARNKGMALFPRLVGGLHRSLCRTDGESTSLASSPDGLAWGEPQLLQGPEASWEVLQVGNCGPPIELDEGWLVLTHGVGPMRTYSIGALLLDLDDPSCVIGRLREPLITPAADEREGYVPHVVYSCGGLVHDDLLWVPYGVGDARIAVAWARVPDVLAAMVPPHVS